MNRVLVLNHSAVPRGVAGITRHADLFSAVAEWEHLIIAGDINRFTGTREPNQPNFLTVRLRSYESNGVQRILSWVQYAAKATFASRRVGHVDAVYASSPHLLTPAAGYIIAKLKGAGFIFEVRDLWPKVLVEMGVLTERSLVFKALSKLERALYARADQVVVMAPAVERNLLDRGIERAKLHYIPNGGSSEDFVASASRPELRARYDFKGFTVIYTGAHGPANGLSLILDAMNSVRDLPITLVLVGGGVDKEALQRQARELNLSTVRFMDPVPKSEIPDLLAAADLGAHVLADVELFRGGVSPNKLFDYMAAGLPILSNSPGLCHELIQASGCGFGVEPDDLAAGLRRAHNEFFKGNLSQMGSLGSAWIDAHQSRQAMAQRLRGVLDSLA
jgi:glycosyltransferase involved in cell wall biosynthesis